MPWKKIAINVFRCMLGIFEGQAITSQCIHSPSTAGVIFLRASLEDSVSPAVERPPLCIVIHAVAWFWLIDILKCIIMVWL